MDKKALICVNGRTLLYQFADVIVDVMIFKKCKIRARPPFLAVPYEQVLSCPSYEWTQRCPFTYKWTQMSLFV